MSNTNKRTGKAIFDKISLGALKIEMIVMIGVMGVCLFKVGTTFIL